MRLSLQLFTVRDAMAQDLEGTLEAIREMGLEYVELAGTYGMAARDFGSVLGRNGLRASGSHVGIEAIEEDCERVIEEARAVDSEWVIVPYVAEGQRNWLELAERLGLAAEKLSEAGLSLAYHNHDFEFGADYGFGALAANSHPLLVHFQIDVGWVQFAGHDPAKLLWDLGGRAPLVHLKDMDPGRDNPHVLAGEGAVRWDEVLAACEGIGVRFGAIEMDRPPTDPIEDVRRCVAYFRDRGLS